MIELNSVVVILMVEALVAMLLILMGLWIWSRRKKNGDFQVANDLIDALQDDKTLRTHKLAKIIAENCVLEGNELQSLLKDIDVREKALYQQIIQIFLNKDPKTLKAVDEYIQDLAKPYCEVLKQASANNSFPDQSAELAAAEKQVTQLAQQNKSLNEQLRLALKTVDEVSDEYTRIFNGHKDEAELRASYKRILYVFQSVENELKQSRVKV